MVPAAVQEYQEAIKLFVHSSHVEEDELRARVEALDKKDAGMDAAHLKRDKDGLVHRQEQLYERIADLETQGAEILNVKQTCDQLNDAQGNVVEELRGLLGGCDARVKELEELVYMLDQDRKTSATVIETESARAADLLKQALRLTPEFAASAGQVRTTEGNGKEKAAGHARGAVVVVRSRLAELEAALADARADAYASCIPAGWLPSSGAQAKDSCQKVATRSQTVSVIERCFCRADTLANHVCMSKLSTMQEGTPTGIWLTQLCLASWRCAGSAAAALEGFADGGVTETAFVGACEPADANLGKLLAGAIGEGGLKPQPLNALSDLEVEFGKLAKKSEEIKPKIEEPKIAEGEETEEAVLADAAEETKRLHKVPPSRRAASLLLRRLEAIFRFGTAVFIGGMNASDPIPVMAPVDVDDSSFSVSGCGDETIGPIVRGKYYPHGENHGYTVFRKKELNTDGQEVLIYFWDDRDGADFSGWWFAPEIGSDSVWAYNAGPGADLPHETGWQVPFDGPVDESFVVTITPPPPPTPSAVQAAPAPKKKKHLEECKSLSCKGCTPEALEELAIKAVKEEAEAAAAAPKWNKWKAKHLQECKALSCTGCNPDYGKEPDEPEEEVVVVREETPEEKKAKEVAKWQAFNNRLHELATRIQETAEAEEGEHEEDLLPPTLIQQLKTLEATLDTASNDDAGFMSALQEAMGPVTSNLDTIERSPTSPLNQTRLQRKHGGGRAPGWASCATEVAADISNIFEMQEQVVELEAKLSKQQSTLEMAQQQLSKAGERRESLQQELVIFVEKQKERESLHGKAGELRAKASTAASEEAALVRTLETIRTRHEEQSRSCEQSKKKRAELEKELDNLRRKPQQEEEGRATAQDLMTLQYTRTVGARELYSLQVGAVLDLAPLPTEAVQRTGQTPALDACLSQYSDLRDDMLKEWSRIRLARLTRDPATGVADQLTKIHQLQLRLSTIRGAVTPLAANFIPSSVAALAGKAAPGGLQVKIEVPCPKWASMGAPRTQTQLAVTFKELCEIHATMS